ncbi:hypothetical protein [Pararhizobium antarcticum]|uniref:hypothetical protein n=1 Tax=Pararhizobium antarcticum TaxID=1798805 RepID=UPI000B032785|nr:hypothetical protein [Pararhizobium antarcticum]
MFLTRRMLLAVGVFGMAGSTNAGLPAFRVIYRGSLFADYFQIYLRDEGHPDLPDDYSDVAIARRLVSGLHAVILHTVRNMTVPVVVEWHNARPAPHLDAYQHVAEAGFFCPSGKLVLAGLTDHDPSAPRLVVKAGPLGVRVNMSGLDTLRENGLEADDHYLLQIWSGMESEDVRVLKAWSGR